MKIRVGFVSNSSSSSFVVAFPKDVELTEENVHKYLYPQGDETFHPYSWQSAVTSRAAVEAIIKDMIEQRALLSSSDRAEELAEHKESVLNCFDDEFGAPCSMWERFPDNFFDLPENKREEIRNKCEIAYDAEYAIYLEKAEDELAKICGENIELFYFSFSDNDGAFWSTMEHGDIFHNVKHWRVSHH